MNKFAALMILPWVFIHMKASPLRSSDFKGKVTKGHE